MEHRHTLKIETQAQPLRQGTVALYWDFENLHGGVAKTQAGEEQYRQTCNKPQEIRLDVAAVLEFAETFGDVIINRAFAHWGKFQRYRTALLDAAVDLVQLFPVGANGKNGADIRLCLDVMDDIARYPHIQTIVIAAGDSDYLPLAQKIRASGRKLHAIGGMLSTNLFWAKSCHSFSYYEQWINARAALQGTLTPPAIISTPSQSAVETTKPATNTVATDTEVKPVTATATLPAAVDDERQALVVQAVLRMTRQEKSRLDAWLPRTRLRPMLKSLDEEQDKQCYGFNRFKTFITHLSDLLEINPKDPTLIRLKPNCFSGKTTSGAVPLPCLEGLTFSGAPSKRLTELLLYPLPVLSQPVMPGSAEHPDTDLSGKNPEENANTDIALNAR